MVPTLPMNIVIIKTILLAADNPAVIPNDSPTVLNAENTSKAMLIKPLLLSLKVIKNIAIPIIIKEEIIIAKALLTDWCEISE